MAKLGGLILAVLAATGLSACQTSGQGGGTAGSGLQAAVPPPGMTAAQVEGNLVHKSLAVEHGTHFEGDSRPSENPLASNPEVPGVERQLNHDGHSETVNQHERGNSLIKSLPELLSA
jgi:hypothetical protein